MKNQIESLSEQAGNTINHQMMSILDIGDKEVTRKELFIYKISNFVTDIRIKIAEWIGGSELHRYCDY